MPRLLVALAPSLLLAFTACESGTGRSVRVTIPEDVSSAHDAAGPGVLVTDISTFGSAVPIIALCGQDEPEEVRYYEDHGFGCLDDALRGTEVTVRAWVAPLPDEWDAGEVCAAVRSGSGPLPLPGVEPYAALAAAPDASWPQGTDVAIWRRDGSPCGGSLNATIALSR